MRILDISQPLGPGTAVWPGDREPALDWSMRRDRGDSVDVAAIALSVHTGTHADGPAHTGPGPAVGELPLAPFIGPAMVLDARSWVEGDPPAVAAGVLDGLDVAGAPRILLRTRDRVDPARFPEAFAALSPALAAALVDRGARLVGTDAPSVDPVASTTLVAHRVLAEGGVVNLENLVLDDVEPGRYTLVALPLRLTEADSSPVRAVLLRDGEAT